MPEQKRDIRTLTYAELGGLLEGLGQPRFRLAQLDEWVWRQAVTSFDEMTNLPKSLRSTLAERFVVGGTEEVALRTSGDGTRKYLLRLPDGTCVECVGMPSGPRLSVCVSTQAGCAMGCAFCATGRQGLERSLSGEEIFAQVAHVSADFAMRPTSVVLMGQGEPFANYDETLQGMRMLNAERGMGIGARHITVSTCGIVPMISRFANEPEQFTLAVSLHSAVQTTRNELMPGVRKFSLVHLHDVMHVYTEKTGRRPSYEYALIAGVNDTEPELESLMNFCGGTLCHVNLIQLNDVEGSPFRPSSPARAEAFVRALGSVGVQATIRRSRGGDIDAACGQLRHRVDS